MTKVVFLNPYGCMRTGTPDRQRALQGTSLVTHFTPEKVRDISLRAMLVAQTYPKLSREAKTTLLHPHIFPVFMGVKDAYIQYEGEPDTQQFAKEIAGFPEIKQNYSLLFFGHYLLNLAAFRRKMDTDGHLISNIGQIPMRDIRYFADGKPGDRDWRFKLRDMLERSVDTDIKKISIHGFLMGYPLADIEYCLTTELGGDPMNARLIANLFGNNMLSDNDPGSEKLLTGWETAMKYGYRMLSDLPDFWINLDPGLRNSTSWLPAAKAGRPRPHKNNDGRWN